MSSASSLVFHRVFVYGTLKRGQPNHHIILNREEFGYSNFVSTGQTVDQFPLILGTRFNIPFLINAPGKGKYVSGEIYNVDDRMFAKLDELEDIPNLYDRIELNIDTGTEDGVLVCWAYVLTKYPEQLLKWPHLNEYNNSVEQPYLERYLRKDDVKPKEDLLYNLLETNFTKF